MTPTTLYFDIVSPFAYLLDAMLRRTDLPLALERKPALLAGLLSAHGNKGPAEIPSKRTYVYEFCTYRAHACGIPFQIPAVHPFNPLRAAGVFGVPTILVADRLFWGEDSLPMLSAYLAGDPVFDSPAMLAARTARYGAHRRQKD